MTQDAPSNYVWWLAGRSAGVVALLLLTASVIVGLAMAARVLPPRWRREGVHVHQHLSLLALGAIGAHGILLAADPWLKAGVTGITVPFALAYRPLWTGVGIIGGYLAAMFVLSFYVRRRIGGRLWRRLHRFTVIAYVLSLAHSLGAGTDASIPLVRYAMLASALPVVGLLALRVASQRRPARPAPRPASDSRPAPSPRPARRPPAPLTPPRRAALQTSAGSARAPRR
jgi:sulfoxide reductase heme-binding subunit YedZ